MQGNSTKSRGSFPEILTKKFDNEKIRCRKEAIVDYGPNERVNIENLLSLDTSVAQSVAISSGVTHRANIFLLPRTILIVHCFRRTYSGIITSSRYSRTRKRTRAYAGERST